MNIRVTELRRSEIQFSSSFFKRAVYSLFLFIFFSCQIWAQNSYLMSLSNGEKISDNVFEFDVLINSTDEDIELTSYQAALGLDSSLANGSISFTYIENTSELSNIPSLGIGANNTDGTLKLTFASLPGSDIISSEVKRVGRFRLESSETFNHPFIQWAFNGNITTILTSTNFTNITEPSSHVSYLSPTSVGDDETLTPEFELFQNYPNPFNPSTKISFNLKQESPAKLTVYNILGEKVADLIDEYLKAGKHEIAFNANDLASGIYIYKLDIDNKFTETRKMILVK